tara:strand:- start:891 stop:1139 length:249 start_codon:yes stop_codon:yes gene_type:complete
MEIVMIKKVGCSPCKKFEPIVKKEAEKHSLGFRRIMQEDMPEEIRPSYFPYFYLYKEGEVIEHWGGTNERKLKSVLKRNLNK